MWLALSSVWAYWPLSLSKIKTIDHWAYGPSSLLTIEPINNRAYRPICLLTVKGSYWPSSPLTIEPIDLSSSIATFKTFGLFLLLPGALSLFCPLVFPVISQLKKEFQCFWTFTVKLSYLCTIWYRVSQNTIVFMKRAKPLSKCPFRGV